MSDRPFHVASEFFALPHQSRPEILLPQRQSPPEEAISHLQAEGEHRTACPDGTSVNLTGKCVLCVGGRAGSIDSYRQIIEQRGGRFLHHDGGQEESLHRIDGFLAAADLVICQADCISHNAYRRVKEQCKRSGKPCLYMKNGGASGLSRLIDQPRSEAPIES